MIRKKAQKSYCGFVFSYCGFVFILLWVCFVLLLVHFFIPTETQTRNKSNLWLHVRQYLLTYFTFLWTVRCKINRCQLTHVAIGHNLACQSSIEANSTFFVCVELISKDTYVCIWITGGYWTVSFFGLFLLQLHLCRERVFGSRERSSESCSLVSRVKEQ